MGVWHVYVLVNSNDIVEWVGETINPQRRFNEHKWKNGKFYNRTDISMHVVKLFNTKREAWDYQCELQKEYNLSTDGENISEAKKGKPGVNKGKTFSIEHRLKIGLASKGRTHSNETKLKMSSNHADVSGKNNPMYGKTRSVETNLKINAAKQKMKEARLKYLQNKNI